MGIKAKNESEKIFECMSFLKNFEEKSKKAKNFLFTEADLKTIQKTLKKYSDLFSEKELLSLEIISGNIVNYDGNIDLSDLPITHLGKLNSVAGFLNLQRTKIQSIDTLEFVGIYLYLNNLIKKKDLPKDLIVKFGAVK